MVADMHKVDRGTVSVTLFFGTWELNAQRTLAHYGITKGNASVTVQVELPRSTVESDSSWEAL